MGIGTCMDRPKAQILRFGLCHFKRNTVVLPQPDRAVGDAESRDRQRGNAGHMAAAETFGQIGQDFRLCTGQLLEFLVECHRAEQHLRAAVGNGFARCIIAGPVHLFDERRVHPCQI